MGKWGNGELDTARRESRRSTRNYVTWMGGWNDQLGGSYLRRRRSSHEVGLNLRGVAFDSRAATRATGYSV